MPGDRKKTLNAEDDVGVFIVHIAFFVKFKMCGQTRENAV